MCGETGNPDPVADQRWFHWCAALRQVLRSCCRDLKGLADKLNPPNPGAEGRGEGRQKGGGLQRPTTARLSKGGPRKTLALILHFLPFEREPRTDVRAGRRTEEGAGSGWTGFGCDTAILRCLIWCLSAIPARGGGWAPWNHWNNWRFYHCFKGISSNEGIQMVVGESFCKYRLRRRQRVRSGGGFTFTAGCNKRERFFLPHCWGRVRHA